MTSCRLCGGPGLASILDLGPQPVCSRYRGPGGGPEYLHPMTLGACGACGVLQMINPVPSDELRPRYDWITYREPEQHLDKLADLVRSLPGITEDSVVGGISFKDDPLLDRLRARGIRTTWRLDPREDLQSTVGGAGVETLEALIRPESGAAIARRRGRPKVLLARHILEHAHDVKTFVDGLKQIAAPDGYLLFELPDSRRGLEIRDCSLLWEEHLFYFTEKTLRGVFGFLALSVERLVTYPYPLENVFVSIVKRAASAEAVYPGRDVLASERALAESFAAALAPAKTAVRAYLQTRGPVAVFGAGHRACVFINALGLQDLIRFVVDDDPNKKGLGMPGSGLPIKPSAALLEERIKTCLLSVSPESEDRVLQRQQLFTQGGGTFVSIYPDSKIGLPLQSLLAGGPP